MYGEKFYQLYAAQLFGWSELLWTLNNISVAQILSDWVFKI